MRSPNAIAGHPLHPMAVTLPIALFTWTLVADIVYLASGRDAVWYDIALWTNLAAIVTALVAVGLGMGDYVGMAVDSDARALATVHMVLNLTIVVLFIGAFAAMWDDRAREGGRLGMVVGFHAVGVGLLMISGWLGGEMVYKHHLSVVPDAPQQARAEHARHEVPAEPGR